MSAEDFNFVLGDGTAGLAALDADFTVLRRAGELSRWLPELGQSCFECDFLVGLDEDLREQQRAEVSAPLILPEMRMMIGTVSEKITIFIRWNAQNGVFVVLTTRDQMARPIDEWMERRAREQRILEETIAQQRDELARINHDLLLSNTQLKQFSSIAAHDLQAPLRQATAFARLLGDQAAVQQDVVANDYLQTMIGSLGRTQKMVASLLHYARLSTRVYDFAKVDMAQTLAAARQNLRLLEAESEAQIVVGDLPLAWGDGVLLTQVWQNLLANAMHYRREASPHIQISGVKAGAMVEFCVADNGIGIEAGQAAAIFEMFRRGPNAAVEGSGIGLSLCLRIVEIHGGLIWFEEGVEAGSKVHFTLPARD